MLMCLGHRFSCPHRGTSLALWPKAGVVIGSPFWRVGCTDCHRTAPRSLGGFDGTAETAAVLGPLLELRDDFVHARGLDRVGRRVAELARMFDHRINPAPCLCGGRFSLAAKPRCPRCDGVAFVSVFHDVYEPNGPA